MSDWTKKVVGKTIKNVEGRGGFGPSSYTIFFKDGSSLVVSASHNDPYAVGSADLNFRLTEDKKA